MRKASRWKEFPKGSWEFSTRRRWPIACRNGTWLHFGFPLRRRVANVVAMSGEVDAVPDAYRGRPPRFADETELVGIGRDLAGREASLRPDAAAAWMRMVAAADAAGIRLLLVSAFRSTARQAEIVRRKRARGLSWEEILRVSAYPGFSEHHTGCAVDISSPQCRDLVEAFEATPEFRWLVEHAAKFGFQLSYPRGNPQGVAYEPWHWCFRVTENNPS